MDGGSCQLNELRDCLPIDRLASKLVLSDGLPCLTQVELF